MIKIEVIGNLGENAKILTGDFKTFYTFDVAVSEKYRDTTGTLIERVTWIQCSVNWDATNLLPFLTKGTKIYVRGTLKQKMYTTRENEQKSTLLCNVQELELLGNAKKQTE